MHRLTDCAECAKVHVNVLEDMRGAGSEDLRGTDVSRTLEIKRLDWPMYWRSCSFIVAKAIARRRKPGNRKEEETLQQRLENQVERRAYSRGSINGWYYGRKTRQLSHVWKQRSNT